MRGVLSASASVSTSLSSLLLGKRASSKAGDPWTVELDRVEGRGDKLGYQKTAPPEHTSP